MSRVAVLPGDGIGPEVTHAAVRVLNRCVPTSNASKSPSAARRSRAALPALPDSTRALCDASDAILFGSVGLPEYEGKPLPERPEYALFLLRRDYELYANLRPVRVFPGLEETSPLRTEIVRGIDLIVVRELTGGIYYGRPKEQRSVDGIEEAVDTMIYRAPEVERIVRIAFELARARRKRVTSVDKQNILETSRLWRRVVEAVAHEYPDVQPRASARRFSGDAARAASRRLRRHRHREYVRRHSLRRSGNTHRVDRNAAQRQSGRTRHARAPLRSLRAYRRDGARRSPGRTWRTRRPLFSRRQCCCVTRLDDDAGAVRIERAVERTYADGLRTAELAKASEAALSTEAFTEAVVARL